MSYMNRDQEVREFLKKYTQFLKHLNAKGATIEDGQAISNVLNPYRFTLDLCPANFTYKFLIPTIEMLASDEQRERLLKPAKELKILAAYSLTELGHGSDLQQIQTTATYDANTKEFVFHTPSISATKFWPGALGFTSTHTVIFCRVVSAQGKDHGVHPLLIQLRDMETHKVLPGVDVGDIGPKIAGNFIDHGYLKLNHYRQPQDALFQRFIKVNEDGSIQTSNEQASRLAYGGMLNQRIHMCFHCSYFIARMATIAVRYSHKRRQFWKKGSSGEEVAIIEY